MNPSRSVWPGLSLPLHLFTLLPHPSLCRYPLILSYLLPSSLPAFPHPFLFSLVRTTRVSNFWFWPWRRVIRSGGITQHSTPSLNIHPSSLNIQYFTLSIQTFTFLDVVKDLYQSLDDSFVGFFVENDICSIAWHHYGIIGNVWSGFGWTEPLIYGKKFNLPARARLIISCISTYSPSTC